MSAKSFGHRVRTIRLARGLSQSELASAVAAITRTRITKSLVSQWEVGRVSDPKLRTVLALRDALQVPVEWLISGEGGADSAAPVYSPRGTVCTQKLQRACALSLAMALPDAAATAEAAVVFYEALENTPSLTDATCLAVAKLGLKSQ